MLAANRPKANPNRDKDLFKIHADQISGQSKQSEHLQTRQKPAEDPDFHHKRDQAEDT